MPRPAPLHTLALALALSAPAVIGTVARAADAPAWNVMVGDAVVDTLDAPLPRTLAAGRACLEKDRWTLEPGDPLVPRLVTAWKPVHHPLVHMVTGEARVRVAVRMRALADGRTEVTVQGGVATEVNLEGSPVVTLARTAGDHECRGYCDEIRARLAGEPMARADAAAGGAGGAAAIRR